MTAADHADNGATASELGRRTLGDLAATIPGATAVLRRFKLDFCCGGERTLAEAAAARGLPIESVAAQLSTLEPDDDRDLSMRPATLIDHIVRRYHEVHRRELPELVVLAGKVEAVHRNHPAVPRGLAAMLQEMRADLEAHMLKEEAILFPAMLAGGNPMIGHPIARMRLEHDQHGERIRWIEATTNDCVPPDGACNTWRALYAGIDKLVDDLQQHIHLENNVLFPQFATELPAAPVCGLS